ncbi:hypothetical protein DICPUDRAFT_146695 [Dictyostelium purpureum]|uniref:Inositol-tetrakisphosphate 1-kinase n=1 Tax=Dictyostelium purpureum TaxID=5786 RepID=F0Z6S5_DICPU|nr:uncharacterized protein DICPUDRAFT_146695 [Dictyostelium purpureum]EGC40315.1 hypothetical protein DICPUDRAFT_146695 [Dictyostelium purpureum]|eukprot:XP_003283066.1 hypothetical protein DICPUDRAFT_146695 [Dictyostelium purpureum]
MTSNITDNLPSDFTVGYYLSKSKVERLKWNSFVDMCKEKYNINCVPLDLEKDVSSYDKQPFHVFINKLTDELGDLENIKNKTKIDKIQELMKRFKTIVQVDSIEFQKSVLGRDVLSILLDKLNDSKEGGDFVKNPNFVLIDEQSQIKDYSELLQKSDITFPCVCKPIKACGSEESHFMGIVFRESDLHQFKLPMLIQQFINHDGIIYKVFAIGDYIHVVHKKSIRNMNQNETELIKFDSQKPFPSTLLPTEDIESKVQTPNKETLKIVAQNITKALGLTLFGFDVIIDSETKKLAVVDINYFPTYGGVQDFYKLLLEHSINLYKQKINI